MLYKYRAFIYILQV